VQFNLGYPRDRIGLLYMAGGVVSFAATRLAGSMLDRIGAVATGTLGVALVAIVTLVGFAEVTPSVPVLAIFIGFMLGNSFRNVTYNTLTTRVPAPHERARFLSLQSAIQHMSAAAGAFLSSYILTELPDGALVGMPKVAIASIGLSIALPFLFWKVEAALKARPARPVPVTPAEAA
jgi:predicted MFS family arabinose efflux permease